MLGRYFVQTAYKLVLNIVSKREIKGNKSKVNGIENGN